MHSGMQTWSRRTAQVQTSQHNREEMWFKGLWMHYGSFWQLSWSEYFRNCSYTRIFPQNHLYSLHKQHESMGHSYLVSIVQAAAGVILWVGWPDDSLYVGTTQHLYSLFPHLERKSHTVTASAGCALLKSVFSSISMLESFDFFIFCSSKKPNATLMGGSYK